MSKAPTNKAELMEVAKELAVQTCASVREKYGQEQDVRFEVVGDSIFMLWDGEILHEAKVTWNGNEGTIELINVMEQAVREAKGKVTG